MTHVKIIIDGKPEPGGSKRVVTLPPLVARLGRKMKSKKGPPEMWIRATDIMKVVRVLDDNPKAKSWKKLVEKAAIEQLGIAKNPEDRLLFDEPLIIAIQFYVARPKNHYKKDGISLTKAGRERPYPTVKPDTLKLTRSTEDALTGVVWSDDAIIVDMFLHKRYADNPEDIGAVIDVFPAAQFQYDLTFRRPS